MVMVMPIFIVVAKVEQWIAHIAGCTYNEVNIIVYYLLVPLSWTMMFDYITRLPLSTPALLMVWGVIIWKTRGHFRASCDWAFSKSVDFLLWFKVVGWDYYVSSVIICVIVPLLIYIELTYAILTQTH